MTSGEFDVDEAEELEDGITYDGVTEIEESEEFSTFAWESEKSITFRHDYTLDKTIKPKEPKKIGKLASLTGSIKIEGSAGFSVTGTFKYYISRKFSEVEFTLTPKVSVNVSVEGVGRFEVKLKSLDYSPCPGVYVGISPKFIVEASVEASFNTTLKFTLGFGYNTNDGLVNKTKKPTFKPEFKIEGKIFIGVDLGPHAYVISKKAAMIELGSEIGAQLTATLSTDNGENHLCNSCLDGDIDLVGDLTGKLVFGETTKWEKKVTITFLSIKIDIVSFYYSYTYDDFGWGDCTHVGNDNDDPDNPVDPDNPDAPNDPDTPNESGVRDSGKCGDNLTWTLYNDGEIRIDGTGAMYNYGYSRAPWIAYEDEIMTVIIGNGVTTIGDFAFDGCYSLTSIEIPDSVTTIGDVAFQGCESLTSVTIPDSVTTIGEYAFAYCSSLTSVTIPDSVTTIGNNTFFACSSLTSVTIPDSVTTIGEYAFWCCDSLTSVTIGNSVTTIGSSAFYYCDSLASVTIPDSVTTIGYDAFSGCDSLTDVYYGGTYEDWSGISIGSNNEDLTEANIHYNGSAVAVASTYGTGTVLLAEDSDENIAITYSGCVAGNDYIILNIIGSGDDYTLSNDTLLYIDQLTADENGAVETTILPKYSDPDSVVVLIGDFGNGTEIREITKDEPAPEPEPDPEPEIKGKVHSVSINDISMSYKDSATVTPTINADSGVKYTVSYSSSNNDVVSVDSNGNITTNDKGSATITVTVTDEYGNTVTDTCNVNVSYKWWQWIIVIVLFGWIWY